MIPLWFAPGEAVQFDWSHEVVVLGGVTTTVKVTHVRLCHSRMFWVRAYPRESQESAFDAHEHAFRLFGGMCQRGIYDDMATAVEAVFVEQGAALQPPLSGDVLALPRGPTACTPSAGSEKARSRTRSATRASACSRRGCTLPITPS